MSPGQPHLLLIPNWDLSAPVVVYNGKKFEQPIMVQLADEGENPTTEAGIRVQLAKDPGIKVCNTNCSLVTVNRLILMGSVHNHLKKSWLYKSLFCNILSTHFTFVKRSQCNHELSAVFTVVCGLLSWLSRFWIEVKWAFVHWTVFSVVTRSTTTENW